MLFINTNAIQIISIIITSLIGIFGISAGIRGYAFRSMNAIERILIILGGLCLIDPKTLTDIIGLLTVGILIVLQLNTKKAKI